MIVSRQYPNEYDRCADCGEFGDVAIALPGHCIYLCASCGERMVRMLRGRLEELKDARTGN